MTRDSLFLRISDVSFPHLLGALEYANASRVAGTEKIGQWFSDVNQLRYAQPFFRTLSGYDHTLFAIDVDIEINYVPKELQHLYRTRDQHRKLKIECGIAFWKQWRERYPDYKFHWRLSGQGLHAVQRYDKPISKQRFLSVIFKLFPPDDEPILPSRYRVSKDTWFRPKKDDKEAIWHWAQDCEWNGVGFRIVIDLHNYSQGERLCRWTYSPYFKLKRVYYSIPIDRWDAQWVIHHSTRSGISPEFIHSYEIPSFQFEEWLGSEEEGEGPAETRERMPAAKFPINVPPPEAELTQEQITLLDEMYSKITGTPEETAPCMKEWYRRMAREPYGIHERGIHFPRVLVLRYLANLGYSADECALFFRFRLNDNMDNAPHNRKKLEQQISYYYGSTPTNPDPVAGCSKIQNSTWEGYICTPEMASICGRRHPVQRVVKRRRQILRRIERPSERAQVTGFGIIEENIRRVIGTGDHYEIVKTTRAGVTTTTIGVCKLLGKRLLVVTPTNRIAERTFPEAIELVKQKYGLDIKGAVVAANIKGCLLLNFILKDLQQRKAREPDWGEKGIAWSRMRHHQKKECWGGKCPYYESPFPLPFQNRDGVNLPVIWSRVTNRVDREGHCALATVYQNVSEWDVVFVTYHKLYALMLNPTEESAQVKEFLSQFDIILLDEVGTYANHAPLQMTLLRDHRPPEQVLEEGMFETDFFQRLREEVILLQEWKDTRGIDEISDYCDMFRSLYVNVREEALKFLTQRTSEEGLTERPALSVIDNPLDYVSQQRLSHRFGNYFALLEKYSQETNTRLQAIEETLTLLREDRWVMNVVFSPFATVDAQFVAAPDLSTLRQFIGEFAIHGQVLATDATMPLVKLSDLFGIDFQTFNLGDPRLTNELQWVLSDTVSINVTSMMFDKERGPEMRRDCLTFCRNVIEAHGEKNVILIAPNKRVFLFLKDSLEDTYPDVLVTYYRSDKTVGVRCDRRVMVTVCAPKTPLGSHLWLAFYYHEYGLFRDMSLDELAERLRLMSAVQAFYQTVGRSKDPYVKDRSVVYTWGLRGKRRSYTSHIDVTELFSLNVGAPAPEVFDFRRWWNDRELRQHRMIQLGKTWVDTGVRISEEAYRLYVFLLGRAEQWTTASEAANRLRLTIPDVERGLKELHGINELGIETSTYQYGQAQKIKARVMND